MGAIPEGIKEMKNGERRPIAHFIGRVEGTETGSSTFGDWVALLGIFKGINLETGEVFRSKKAFMPDAATEQVIAYLDNIENEGDSVEFALEIGIQRVIKKDAKDIEVGVGYEYSVSPLIEADMASDPLTEIEARMQQALPAPAQSEISEVEPTKNGKGKK